MSEHGGDDMRARGGPQQQQQQRRSYGNGRGGRRRGNSGRPRDNSNSEKELASQQIQVLSKRFYIDVKENQRGRFIKLVEIGSGGRKSRIIMTTSAAAELKNHLTDFSEINAQMEPAPDMSSPATSETTTTTLPPAVAIKKELQLDNDGLIKSETFIKDRKRYYLDFKENQRGRFLKVSMIMNQGRSQIAIPAQGLAEFRDQLSDMLDKFGVSDDEEEAAAGGAINDELHRATNGHQSLADLPESQSFKADSKTFYFDCDSNSRGIFLKVSEVRQSNRYRTSITIPDNALKQFKESLNEFIDKTIAATEEAAAAECATASSTAGPSAVTAVSSTVD